MGRVFVFLAIGAFLSRSAIGQARDSIRTVTSDSVIVIGIREANLPTIDAESAIVAPVAELQRRSGSALASNALASLSSSLNVRRYAPFGSAFLSYRGLPAEYTAVYRDGLRIPSEQNSLVDVGQLSLYGVDRVEVLPSSEAIVLGGDAIGAAINFVSRDFDTARVRVSNEVRNYGSSETLGDITTTAEVSLPPVANVSLFAGASDANSTGRFPYAEIDPETKQATGRSTVRAMNDATLVSEFANASWIASANNVARLRLNHFRMDRGLPGAAMIAGVGASLFDTRELDDQTLSSLSFAHTTDAGGYSIAGSYQDQFESYSHPQTNTHDSSTIRTFDAVARWSMYLPFVRVFAGAEYCDSRLAGTTNALPNGDSIVTRARDAVYVAASRISSGYELSAAVRAEHVSSMGAIDVLPQITGSVRLTDFLDLHAGYSRSFHPPTLNELYWSSEGGIPNPDLRPERGESWSAMASGHFDLANVQLSANATYFHTRVKDEILWLVNGQNTSSPYNLGPIVTKGVELRAKAGTTLWGLSIDAEESYTFLDTRVFDAEFYDKEVPYSTPTTSLCTIDIGRHDLGAMVATVRYHGHRYGDPGNSEGRRIEPATLVDASYDAPGWLLTSIAFHMRLSVVNIFDVQESEFPGYPLPGRTLSLTTSLTY